MSKLPTVPTIDLNSVRDGSVVSAFNALTKYLEQLKDSVEKATNLGTGDISMISSPGATFSLPVGVTQIAETIRIRHNGVSILGGNGGFAQHDIQPFTNYTHRLEWIGPPGGTMIEIEPEPGANNQRLEGVSIRGVAFICNGANIGLSIKSHAFGIFEGLFFLNPNIVGIDMNVIPGSLGEAKDTQFNQFQNTAMRLFETSAIGIRLGGDPIANASFNNFTNTSISHVNLPAIQLGNSDTNLFTHTLCFRPPGFAGYGVEFLGNPNLNLSSRANNFIDLVAISGGVIARSGSLANRIFMYDPSPGGNGSPAPVIEPFPPFTNDQILKVIS